LITVDVVLTGTRVLHLFFEVLGRHFCLLCRSLPLSDTGDLFLEQVLAMLNIVVSWANPVELLSSEPNLIGTLLDELALLILFVSENCLVAGN
jgi:hypothetical protein